jgi:hypothetical protein
LITDEIRHKAWDAFTTCKSEFISDKLHAALEVVEPMLIAQGLREASRIISDDQGLWDDNIRGTVVAIEARAQELDQK